MDDVQRMAVLGAGTMGRGVAYVAALAGFDVHVFDVGEAPLDLASAAVAADLRKGVARGKVSEEDVEPALARLTYGTDLEAAVEDADLVIEAVPEDLDLKRRLLGEVAAVAPDHAVLATNTSSLSVTAIAAAVPRPGQVVGMHFFNPVAVMKLLEIVRAEQTAPETVAAARAVGERMGREMIVVSDSAGFATSRLGLVIGLEAMRMLEQGVATASEIDTAMELGYRHPMGPLRLTDLVGLDVRLAIAEYLHREIGEQFRPPQILRRMVRAGKLGKKTGEGFYRWDA